ncbi:dynein assembly factor 1, axonemal-like [Myzus persicae]|uniref:dynein assembly factor 1, axonemal-like n=1 Tax=Myzus persicae TaxID=13164 RepID=UPI000B939D5C|nr:dynein assembly factor 1, axonemal-like [Myzus persicae]
MGKIDELNGGFHKRHEPGMTKETLKEICKENKLYFIPSHNDVLYLHFRGFSKIENLEEYTGLKCLWLENNCLTNISGLDNQTKLVGLYMHNNAISKIENLDFLIKLNTINLSHNFVKIIENLDHLQDLNSLIISHNKLSTASDIAHLANCKTLSILDLSFNYLDDPEIIDVFTNMESLRVLSLTGNSVISKIKNYRKTLTIKCKELRNLDERPIFKKDRLCAEAWSTGGIEAEQAMRTKLNEIEQKTISDSVNALISLRRNRNVQITPSASGDSGQGEGVDVSHHDSTASLIVSKDYYDECDSSDDDSTDDGSSIKDASTLVNEIADNNDAEDNSAADGSVDRSAHDNVVVNNDEGLSEFESDVINHLRRLPAGERSGGSQEDSGGRHPIIGVSDDGVESVERLNEKCEHFVENKADEFANDAEVNNTEPSLEQYTDGRLCSNDSNKLMIERTENKLVYAEINYVNDELNTDESGKQTKTNFDFNENSSQTYDNNVINNDHRNFGGSIEINNTLLKDNDSETYKNLDLNERQSFESLPLLCPEQTNNTSQILCPKRLNTHDTIDHDNADEESSLTILTATCESDRNEIKEIPIKLPWLLPPQTKEEFYIKKSSE